MILIYKCVYVHISTQDFHSCIKWTTEILEANPSIICSKVDLCMKARVWNDWPAVYTSYKNIGMIAACQQINNHEEHIYIYVLLIYIYN